MLRISKLLIISLLMNSIHLFSSAPQTGGSPSSSAAAAQAARDEPKRAQENAHAGSNSAKAKQESSLAQQVGEQKKSKEEAASFLPTILSAREQNKAMVDALGLIAQMHKAVSEQDITVTMPKYTQSEINHIIESAPKEVKDLIKQLESKEALYSEYATKKLLLVGEPGTGKSSLASVIAAKCKMPCVMARASLLSTEYQNSGDQNLKKIFDKADSLKQPCVVYIDELQVILDKHKSTKRGESTMLTSLWSLLDQYADKPILFIGALNYAKDVPKQFIDRCVEDVVEMSLPDDKMRERIILFYQRQRMEDYINGEVPEYIRFDRKFSNKQFVKITQGFTFRKIKRTIHAAMRAAKSRYYDGNKMLGFAAKAACINMQDIENAIKKSSKKSLQQRETLSGWLKKHQVPITIALSITGLCLTAYIAYKQSVQAQRQHNDNQTLSKDHHKAIITQSADHFDKSYAEQLKANQNAKDGLQMQGKQFTHVQETTQANQNFQEALRVENLRTQKQNGIINAFAVAGAGYGYIVGVPVSLVATAGADPAGQIGGTLGGAIGGTLGYGAGWCVSFFV